MDRFEKQSDEKFTIEINFSNDLETNEIISSYIVTGVINSNDQDVESVIIDSTDNNDESIFITVKAGSNGYNYKLTATITTSLENIYEKDIIMAINNV